MRSVRVIPTVREFSSGQATHAFAPKRRVAGYARVSTDSDDQYASYEAQVDYSTTMIKANAEWEFVGIYTDEGISGTSTNRREGFKRMIDDALAGKIDLIVTKSVNRFARNTVDSLQTIRKLKEHKVEVVFEKEGIRTFDSNGELLITIMSSLAQEESRSISENVKWGRRKRFAEKDPVDTTSHKINKKTKPENTEHETQNRKCFHHATPHFERGISAVQFQLFLLIPI